MVFLCVELMVLFKINPVDLINQLLYDNIISTGIFIKSKMRSIMTTFTPMKTTFQEESFIPKFAVQAFHEAYSQAKLSSLDVVYAENGQLLKKNSNGHIVVVKDLKHAYVSPNMNHAVLKRRRKSVEPV